jgi:hypothetical protein
LTVFPEEQRVNLNDTPALLDAPAALSFNH